MPRWPGARSRGGGASGHGDGPSGHGGRPELDRLIDALERAGLHGHGGAYFPTATKLRAVALQRGRPVVVVNAAEGEPLSRKDRFLLTGRTDQVLDGALAAARALGSDVIVFAVDERRVRTVEFFTAAVADRAAAEGDGAPAMEVIGVPPGFVTGQETALVNYLNGREAKPTLTPPYPFERGVDRRPTLVSNAETYAQIGRIVGGDEAAMRCVTVSGAVPRTTIVEVGSSTTVAGAIEAAGGTTEPLIGVLLGGYGGTWAPAATALDLPLDEFALRRQGLTLGAGIIHALGSSACPVAEVARVTRWMAGQSAGQCGPCVFGLDAIARAAEVLAGGSDAEIAPAAAIARLERWCAMVDRRGGCAHPDGVARYVRSALAVFPDRFAAHAGGAPCAVCGSAVRSPSAGEPMPAWS